MLGKRSVVQPVIRCNERNIIKSFYRWDNSPSAGIEDKLLCDYPWTVLYLDVKSAFSLSFQTRMTAQESRVICLFKIVVQAVA
jgi:hypothetical protein